MPGGQRSLRSDVDVFVSSNNKKKNLRNTKFQADDTVEEQSDGDFTKREEDMFEAQKQDDGGLLLTAQVESPQAACCGYYQASIYIAADSDFVADAQAEFDICTDDKCSSGKAAAAIQDIFADVRAIYYRDNCIELTLKGYDIRTDPRNDPYRDLRLSSSSVCNDSNGLLQKTSSWLIADAGSNDPSGGDRTLFHLFYGLPDTSGRPTIGCAWVGTPCSARYGVGVNEMSYRGLYSSSLVLKRNLLAHEMGHNFNGKCSHEEIIALKGIMIARTHII